VDQGEWNTEIHKRRIRNEWGIGDVKNHFRVFSVRWSYGSELSASFYEAVRDALQLAVIAQQAPHGAAP